MIPIQVNIQHLQGDLWEVAFNLETGSVKVQQGLDKAYIKTRNGVG